MSDSASGKVNGTVMAGYEGVRAAFEENLASGLETGGAFAVYRDGAPLVDLWGGRAVGAGAGDIAEDALFGIFSSTKGAASVCVAMLVDRGIVDYDAPVATYWPEFAAGGKSAITVAQMMSHQAGLTGAREPMTLDDFIEHDRLASCLAAQEPFFQPGAFGYHALTFGTLADELVRRTDGRTLGRFFADEVRAKLGIDVFVGLPAEEDARYTPVVSAMDGTTMLYDQVNADAAYAALANPPIVPEWPNQRIWREAALPGASGTANARGLAQLYSALVTDEQRGGTRIVSREVLAQATRERVAGVDQALGGTNRYACGFSLNIGTMGSNTNSFGHAGFGGTMAFADPARRLGVGYTNNKMLNPDWQAVDPRLKQLLRALYKADAATA